MLLLTRTDQRHVVFRVRAVITTSIPLRMQQRYYSKVEQENQGAVFGLSQNKHNFRFTANTMPFLPGSERSQKDSLSRSILNSQFPIPTCQFRRGGSWVTALTGLIPLFDQRIACAGKKPFVFLFHISDGAAIRKMKFFCIRICNIVNFRLLCCCLRCAFCGDYWSRRLRLVCRCLRRGCGACLRGELRRCCGGSICLQSKCFRCIGFLLRRRLRWKHRAFLLLCHPGVRLRPALAVDRSPFGGLLRRTAGKGCKQKQHEQDGQNALSSHSNPLLCGRRHSTL